MLVIRLARGGRNKYPTYRIVAAESARAATGKFVEILGHYNPHTKELVIKKEETLQRISNGAQPSNTVVKLLQREKMELPAWVKLKTKEPKKQDEPEVAGEAAAVEASDEVASTPASTDEPVDDTAAAPAEEEVRVAEVATDNAADTEENRPATEKTETREDTDRQADAATEASDAAADAADNAAADSDEAKS